VTCSHCNGTQRIWTGGMWGQFDDCDCKRPFFECPGCGKDVADTDKPHEKDCVRAIDS
jgi:hypothetical protein